MKKRLVISLALLPMILGLSWATVGGATATPNSSLLVINEVYAPTNSNFVGQYFEIYNGTGQTIDLSGYSIFNSAGSDRLNTLPNPLIGPGQNLAIGANLLPNQRIGSGLNPASDFLALVLNGPQDVTIDQLNWGRVDPTWPNFYRFQPYFSNPPTMPTDGTNSLQRYPNGHDTDQASDFVSLPGSPSNPPPTYTPTTTPIGTSTITPTPLTATVTPTPFCGDAYEPDNLPTQAHNLDLATEQTHTICPTRDEDWFIINVVTGKVYTIFTKDLGGSLDTIMAVYTYPYDGTKIAENDDQPGCLCSRIDMNFPSSGLYYVRVRDNRGLGGLGWTYTVGFTATPGPAPTNTPVPTATPNPFAPTATPITAPCLDPYEPDGVPAAAHLLLIGEIQPGHNFCPGGDADWYKFFGGRGKAYTIQTSDLGIGVDTYLYLFDSDGRTILAQNDDQVGPPPGGSPNDVVASRLDFFPIRDDFYYIMVKNKGDLGSPTMIYNVSLRVQANVPPPAGTTTPIIAPIVTVTNGPAPTAAPFPTSPPGPAGATSTPTQPPPGPAEASATPTQPPPGPAEATTTPAQPPQPAATTPTPVIETPVPGDLPTPTEPVVPLPQTGVDKVVMPFQVYLDRNGNGRYDPGEGVYGLRLVLQDDGGATAAVTNRTRGAASALLHRNAPVTISIPYLHWSGKATVGPNGLMIRLPAPALPSRIP